MLYIPAGRHQGFMIRVKPLIPQICVQSPIEATRNMNIRIPRLKFIPQAFLDLGGTLTCSVDSAEHLSALTWSPVGLSMGLFLGWKSIYPKGLGLQKGSLVFSLLLPHPSTPAGVIHCLGQSPDLESIKGVSMFIYVDVRKLQRLKVIWPYILEALPHIVPASSKPWN